MKEADRVQNWLEELVECKLMAEEAAVGWEQQAGIDPENQRETMTV